MRRMVDPRILEEKAIAFRRIHADLKEVMKQDQCRLCSCFHADVLEKVYQTLKSFNDSEPEHRLVDILSDFEDWTRDFDRFKMHG